MSPRAWRLSPAQWGCLILSATFLGLYFLEPLILNRPRKFLSATSTPEARAFIFPLEERFSILYSGRNALLAGKREISLKELASKNLLINFWATWCDPCIEEIPSLNLLASQLRQATPENIPLLVTISVDETAEVVKNLEKTVLGPFEFIVLHDPDGKWAKSLGVIKFPETFLINPEGKLLFKWLGPQDWLSLETLQVLSRA